MGIHVLHSKYKEKDDVKYGLKGNGYSIAVLLFCQALNFFSVWLWENEFIQDKIVFHVLIYGIAILMVLVTMRFDKGYKRVGTENVYARQFVICLILIFLDDYLNRWGIISDLSMRVEYCNIFLSSFIIAEITCERRKQ